MLLSIIIPVYNVEQFVEKCIRSCESQDVTKDQYEIIVVNDGSKDNSLEVVQRVAAEYDNIRVFSQPNAGLSAARNMGMRLAKGEYYMFVDSDDWIAEKCLGRLMQKLESEKPDALAICAANMINGIPQRRQSHEDETPIKGYELLKRGVQPCAQLAIWNAEFLKRYNLAFYEGIFHEDSEFTPRAYYLAEKISLTNEIIYYFYPNPNSITRTVNPKKSFDIVKVVCESLSKFSNEVLPEHRNIFYDEIALNVNNALNGIRFCDLKTQKEFCEELSKHKHLFDDMLKSKVLKYRIEARFFKIFPNSTLRIYNLMQLLNFRR